VSHSVPATRFDDAFAARGDDAAPGVIPYFTAGFPRLDDTVALLLAAQRCGCVAVEVGVPFSDPLADGPTIQRAGWQALQQGMTLPLAMEQVRAARRQGLHLPVAFMTYVNPVLSYGVGAFARDAVQCGADGAIIPDLPADEAGELRRALHGQGMALIPLIAPTTPRERIVRATQDARGFVYCVGVTGVTGARNALAPEALQLLDAVREVSPLPRALGFGISQPHHLMQLRGRAEAVVIGSALLDAIDAAGGPPVSAAESFLQRMTVPG